MCFSVLACYLPVWLDFTIDVNVILGTVLRAPKGRSRLAAATGAAATLTVGVRSLGQAGWGLDFHPGWSQHLPPPQIPAHFLALVVAAEVRGEREGSVSRARHGQSSEPPLQLSLLHCGHIQLQSIFAFCFQAPAYACPALFHLRSSHSARVRGRVSVCMQLLCKEPTNDSTLCASLFLKTTC